jgi:hypothetical protein
VGRGVLQALVPVEAIEGREPRIAHIAHMGVVRDMLEASLMRTEMALPTEPPVTHLALETTITLMHCPDVTPEVICTGQSLPTVRAPH